MDKIPRRLRKTLSKSHSPPTNLHRDATAMGLISSVMALIVLNAALLKIEKLKVKV